MKKMILICFLIFAQSTYSQWNILQIHQTDKLTEIFPIDSLTAWCIGSQLDFSSPTMLSGVAYYTSNGISNFKRLNIPNPGRKVFRSVYFIDKNTGWIAGERGLVLFSSDGGANWATYDLDMSVNIKKIQFADKKNGWAMVSDTKSHLLRTTDGGQTWISPVKDIQVNVTSFRFLNNNFGVASAISNIGSEYRNLIWKTTDGGMTWDSLPSSPRRVTKNVVFTSDKIGYLFLDNGEEFYKTTDGGDTWTVKAIDDYSSITCVDFTNDRQLWLGGLSRIYFTNDGGESWVKQDIPDGDLIESVRFLNEKNGWACGGIGLVYNTINNAGTKFANFTSDIREGTIPFQVNFINTSFVDYSNYDWNFGDGGTSTVPNPGHAYTTAGIYNVKLKVSKGSEFVEVTKSEYIRANPPEIPPEWFSQMLLQNISSKINCIYFPNDTLGYLGTERNRIYRTEDAGLSWDCIYNTSEQAKGENFSDIICWGENIIALDNNTPKVSIDKGGVWIDSKIDTLCYAPKKIFMLTDKTGWFCGSTNDIWRVYNTTDGGISWISLFQKEFQPINDIYFFDEHKGIAIGNGFIYRTTDGGHNWIPEKLGSENYNEIEFAGISGWICGNNATIYKSNDYGATWTPQSPPASIGKITFNTISFADSDFGWAGGDNGIILKTTDGGMNWAISPSNLNLTINKIFSRSRSKSWAVSGSMTVLSSFNPGKLKADFTSDTTSGEALTTIHFYSKCSGFVKTYLWDFGDGEYSSEKNPAHTYKNPGYFNVKLVVYDFNRWDSLTKIDYINIAPYKECWYPNYPQTTASLNKVFFGDRNVGCAVGNSGVVLITTNSGLKWQKIGGEVSNRYLNDVFFLNSNLCWIVTDMNTLSKTTNGGLTWIQSKINEDYNIQTRQVWFADSLNGYVVTHNGTKLYDQIYETKNGGLDWNPTNIVDTNHWTKYYFINKDKIIGIQQAATRYFGIYENGWKKIDFGRILKVNALAAPKNDVFIVVCNDGIITKSSDNGASWRMIKPLNDDDLMDVRFIDELRGYACGENGNVIYTSDGGESWIKQYSNTRQLLTSIFPVDSNYAFAAGTKGEIIKTVQGGGQSYLVDFNYNVINSDDPSKVEFTNLSIVEPAAYEWSFGDGEFSSELNPVHFYSKYGTYKVKIIVRKGNKSDSTDKIVNVTPFFKGLNKFTLNARKNPYPYDIKFIDGIIGYIGYKDGKFAKTTDGGKNWMHKFIGQHVDINSIFFSDSNTGYALCSYNLLARTVDGGETWSFIDLMNDQIIKDLGPDNGWTNSYITFSDNLHGIIYGSVKGFIMITSDGGNTWKLINTKAEDFLVALFSFNNYAYFLTYWGVLGTSVDKGLTWALAKPYPFYEKYFYKAFFIDEQNGWTIDFPGASFLSTTNGGVDWVAKPFNKYYGLFEIIFKNSLNGILAYKDLCYQTTNNGITWNNLPIMLGFFPTKTAYNSQSGYWFVGLDVASTKTDYVLNYNEDGISGSWEDAARDNIDIIYPNPASDFVEISLINPQIKSWVQEPIRIYNALGEIVINVVAIHELPQRIDVSALPPGIYYVKAVNNVLKFLKL